MSNTTGKTGFRKTTVVLSAILVLLVLFVLTVYVIIPAGRRYYITHLQYPIYGGMTQELKDSNFYKDITSGRSVCFLGDSITAGNEIEGINWYYPLIPYIKGNISNDSCGGWMVHHLINETDNIPASDIYVIAIGVNDIIFTNSLLSAKTAEEYTSRLNELTEKLKAKAPDARFYFITPWTFHNQEDYYILRAADFRTALINWCNEKEYICINPDPILVSVFEEKGASDYMKDNFHPNAPNGVGLYSYAVLKAAIGK